MYGWQEGERIGIEEDAVDAEDGEMIKGWGGARVFVACGFLPSLTSVLAFARRSLLSRKGLESGMFHSLENIQS